MLRIQRVKLPFPLFSWTQLDELQNRDVVPGPYVNPSKYDGDKHGVGKPALHEAATIVRGRAVKGKDDEVKFERFYSKKQEAILSSIDILWQQVIRELKARRTNPYALQGKVFRLQSELRHYLSSIIKEMSTETQWGGYLRVQISPHLPPDTMLVPRPLARTGKVKVWRHPVLANIFVLKTEVHDVRTVVVRPEILEGAMGLSGDVDGDCLVVVPTEKDTPLILPKIFRNLMQTPTHKGSVFNPIIGSQTIALPKPINPLNPLERQHKAAKSIDMAPVVFGKWAPPANLPEPIGRCSRTLVTECYKRLATGKMLVGLGDGPARLAVCLSHGEKLSQISAIRACNTQIALDAIKGKVPLDTAQLEVMATRDQLNHMVDDGAPTIEGIVYALTKDQVTLEYALEQLALLTQSKEALTHA